MCACVHVRVQIAQSCACERICVWHGCRDAMCGYAYAWSHISSMTIFSTVEKLHALTNFRTWRFWRRSKSRWDFFFAENPRKCVCIRVAAYDRASESCRVCEWKWKPFCVLYVSEVEEVSLNRSDYSSQNTTIVRRPIKHLKYS